MATISDSKSQLDRQLGRVERRLFASRTFAAWPWTAAVAVVVLAAIAVVDRFLPLGFDSVKVTLPALLGVAAMASLFVAAAWGLVRREDRLSAAIELDRRCKLAERVSSAVACDTIDLVAAEAVRLDAERTLAKLDVRPAFPLAPSRRTAWALAPIAVALAAVVWLKPSTPPQPPVAPTVVVETKEAAKELEQRLGERKREAERLQLAEARQLLERLQEEARKLADADKLDPKETLVKLNDLGQQLEERRKEVAVADEMRKQLSRLRSKETGPGEKLAQALKRGDFEAARDQVETLRKQLQGEKLDQKQREALTKQLDDLQQQLEQMAKEQTERQESLEKQLADKREVDRNRERSPQQDAGDSSSIDPSALSEELAKLAKENQELDQLQQSICDACDKMKQGSGQDAQKALSKLQDDLEKLRQKQKESQLLDGGRQDLAECKSGMCRGGEGERLGDAKKAGRNGMNDQGGGGSQWGRGVNRTEDPTEGDDRKLVDSRVRPEVRPGSLRVVGDADGPNSKGTALQVIQQQAAAVAGGADPQPIEHQVLDRSRRDQKRQYFDSLRKGE
jgi:hypothetical protein